MSQVSGLIDFLVHRRDAVLEQTVEHIGLTLTALLIALLIGVPLGLLLTRRKKLSGPVLGITGAIQTIPSVALLGFLLPILGIGVVPAITALFLYALLPIVRNTYTGIEEVDPAVREAARGMGMSDGQVLRRVELPLAIPVIFAGIRTATVINIGIATLCALIGAGGLGEFIFRGIALNNLNMILAGAIPAALLALLMDAGLGLIQRHIARIWKTFCAAAGVLFLVIFPVLMGPFLFSPDFTAGFTSEFMERPDGFAGLRRKYNLSMRTEELDPGLMYRALKNKKVDLICGFSTDGRIEAYNLRVLQDDKSYFPRYDAAPLIRGETLRKFPELRDVFNKLAGRMTDPIMRDLNYQVDFFQRTPEDIADAFLDSLSLPTAKKSNSAFSLTIGSKNFTEQYILAHIFAGLIERMTDIKTNLKTGLAGTKICFDALRSGDIDLYPEYTGTGLFVLLETDQNIASSYSARPKLLMDFVRNQTQRRFDIEWMSPLGFNNSYALMMREKQASRLGIKFISDLSRHLSTLSK